MVGWIEAAGAGRDEFRPDWAAKKRREIGCPVLLNSCSLDPRKYIEFLSTISRIGLPMMCGRQGISYDSKCLLLSKKAHNLLRC